MAISYIYRYIAPFLMFMSTLFSVDTHIHHEFCESYLWEHRIEVLNVLSSLLMIYFPLKSMEKRQKDRNYIPELILIATATGSALFHYHKTYLTALFDEIPMILFVLTVISLMYLKNLLIMIFNMFFFFGILTSKLYGMNSHYFAGAFAFYSVIFGLKALYDGIVSKGTASGLIGIAIFRQIIEDHCLKLPIIVSLFGHPAWHIVISYFAVMLCDNIYEYREKLREIEYKKTDVDLPV